MVRSADNKGEMMMKLMSFATIALVTAPAAALAQGVTPGQWEIAVTINSVDMPGQPDFIAKMMTGKTTKVKHCVTPEEAARGPQDMLKSSKACSFTRYSMVGGKLNSEMVCKQGGSVTTSVSSGSFTPTGFTATGRSVSTGQMPMTMQSSSTGRLLGPCKK